MSDFESDMKEMLGELMKTDEDFCERVWSSLANVDWYNIETHEEVSYSFRAAGDLISEIIGKGNYMDWYCSGPYATVNDVVAREMRKKGWVHNDILNK